MAALWRAEACEEGRAMSIVSVGRALGLSVALLIASAGCERPAERPPPVELEPSEALRELEAQTAEFERKVYRVTDGVYQAVGFGIANSILIEGRDGVIVVDVLGSVESARAVKAELEKITRKPIVALIYTHNHGDHVFGGLGFVPDGEVDVYAHATTEYYIDRVVNVIRPIISVRSTRMFGGLLPREGPDRLVNVGIGPFLEVGDGTLGLIRPNRTFEDELEVEISGVRLHLVHAPGETNDQIFVWLPEKRVLLPGDNVYKAFPNLYTIRGTLYRDPMRWVESLDRMRALRPEHLAPSHTRPVSGAERIQEILTAYRDGIQFVHDQTIRGMNRGLTPDELVEEIRLPAHLEDHPFLRELYGTVEWSVRSIFTGYLGWFDGDTATLSPASPDERAAGMVELAGGIDGLVAATRAALDDERYAWAAELATHALRVEPEREDARELKASALRALAHRTLSPNGRNYYLTQALELEGSVEPSGPGIDESVLNVARAVPIGNYIAAMPVNLDPEGSADVDTSMAFRFPDVDEAYTLHVRRGVAEFRVGAAEDPDLSMSADTRVWIDIVLGQRGIAGALASGDLELEGGVGQVPAVLRFLSLFRPVDR
jgi:alkyl sulfatase BDS1-like metallo-beta-lactamase superfamily hydrolase